MKNAIKWNSIINGQKTLFLATVVCSHQLQLTDAHYIRTHSRSFISRVIKSEFHAINHPVYDPNFAFSMRGVSLVFRVRCEAIFRRLHIHNGVQRFMHPTAGAETQWIWYLCECPRCRFIISAERQHYFIICICKARRKRKSERAPARPHARVWSVSAPASMSPPRPSAFPQQKLHAGVLFFFEVWGIKRSLGSSSVLIIISFVLGALSRCPCTWRRLVCAAVTRQKRAPRRVW